MPANSFPDITHIFTEYFQMLLAVNKDHAKSSHRALSHII